MRYILSAESRPILQRFAQGKVLLAFDFDGTLAPIVPDPNGAVMRGVTRKALKKLTAQYPCIVVSGRGRADVRQRVRGIGFDEVIGNHGVEPWQSSRAAARTVKDWIPRLRSTLGSLHGVTLENKQFSVSVHYRQARRKKQAIEAIQQAARALKRARLIGGKQVVNVVLRGAPDKGIAVERERRKRHCDKVLYVGDDDTDETVFARAQERCGRYLTIRVGAKRSSLAGFYLRDQKQIDDLLRVLLALRAQAAAAA